MKDIKQSPVGARTITPVDTTATDDAPAPTTTPPASEVGLDPNAGHTAGTKLPASTVAVGGQRHELAMRLSSDATKKAALGVLHPAGKTSGSIAQALDRLAWKGVDKLPSVEAELKTLLEGGSLPTDEVHRDVIAPIVRFAEKYADPSGFATKNPLKALSNLVMKRQWDDRFAVGMRLATTALAAIDGQSPDAGTQLSALRSLSRAGSTGYFAHPEVRDDLRGLSRGGDRLSLNAWKREAERVGQQTIAEIAEATPTSAADFEALKGLVAERVYALDFGDGVRFPQHTQDRRSIMSGAERGLPEVLRAKATQLVNTDGFLDGAPVEDLQALWKSIDPIHGPPNPAFEAARTKLGAKLVERTPAPGADAKLWDLHTRAAWLTDIRGAMPDGAPERATIDAAMGEVATQAAKTPGPSADEEYFTSSASRRFDQLSDIAAQLPEDHPAQASLRAAQLEHAPQLMAHYVEGLSKASTYRDARWDREHIEKLAPLYGATLDAAGREALDAKIEAAEAKYDANVADREAAEAAAKKKKRRSSRGSWSSRRSRSSGGMSMAMKVALIT
ncbi:MAG: hypothetical protein RIT81_27805 [Deltaproteobacteria bacterium]